MLLVHIDISILEDRLKGSGNQELLSVVQPAGYDPTAPWLKVKCSTDWATIAYKWARLESNQRCFKCHGVTVRYLRHWIYWPISILFSSWWGSRTAALGMRILHRQGTQFDQACYIGPWSALWRLANPVANFIDNIILVRIHVDFSTLADNLFYGGFRPNSIIKSTCTLVVPAWIEQAHTELQSAALPTELQNHIRGPNLTRTGDIEINSLSF